MPGRAGAGVAHPGSPSLRTLLDAPTPATITLYAEDGSAITTKTQAGVWRIPVEEHDPADEVQLVSNDTVVQMWSPDGSRIAHIDRAAASPFPAIVPAEGGEPVDLGSLSSGGYVWAPDGASIVVQRCFSGGCGFEIIDPLTGEHIVGADVQTAVGFPSWQRLPQ